MGRRFKKNVDPRHPLPIAPKNDPEPKITQTDLEPENVPKANRMQI